MSLEDLGLADERLDLELLDGRQQQPGDQPRERRGEDDAPEHCVSGRGTLSSVAYRARRPAAHRRGRNRRDKRSPTPAPPPPPRATTPAPPPPPPTPHPTPLSTPT